MKRLVSLVLALLILTGVAFGQEWAKTYGEAGKDRAIIARKTSDGGYVVAGYTESFGAGGRDIWVLKLDNTGRIKWQKTYGGNGDEVATALEPTKDGGYVLAGYTESFGAGGKDIWVLKLDVNGNPLWQKAFGGVLDDMAFAIASTADNGYIVAGSTESFGAGGKDIWVLKLDANGNPLWQKAFGGEGCDGAFAVQQTRDGGVIVAGYSQSFGIGDPDIWILKLSANGTIQWQESYGELLTDDSAYIVREVSDGGYVVAGYTESFGAGGRDIWVLKLDNTGRIKWQKTYGGNGDEVATALEPTKDGGYVLAGYTESFGAGGKDIWVLKLDANGNLLWQKAFGGSDNDGALTLATIEEGYLVAGYTKSYGAGDADVWVLKLDKNGNIQDPNCAIIKTTNATVLESNALIIEPQPISPLNTTATIRNTTANINSFTVHQKTICYYQPTFLTNLTVNLSGKGFVTSTPAGISCPGTCMAQFNKDTEITLKATPNKGYVFVGWGGDCTVCENTNPCTIIISTDKNCTAIFESEDDKPEWYITCEAKNDLARVLVSVPSCGKLCGQNTKVKIIAASPDLSTFFSFIPGLSWIPGEQDFSIVLESFPEIDLLQGLNIPRSSVAGWYVGFWIDLNGDGYVGLNDLTELRYTRCP